MHHLLSMQVLNFWLNLPMRTVVTAAFVRSPHNVKCPVLNNQLLNPDSVYGLLGNYAMNVLAPYPFLVSAA